MSCSNGGIDGIYDCRLNLFKPFFYTSGQRDSHRPLVPFLVDRIFKLVGKECTIVIHNEASKSGMFASSASLLSRLRDVGEFAKDTLPS